MRSYVALRAARMYICRSRRRALRPAERSLVGAHGRVCGEWGALKINARMKVLEFYTGPDFA